MPLFTVELDRLADNIGASDLTIRLHTSVPSDGSPTAGRTTTGGGSYGTGTTLASSDISDASSGDIENTAAISFGTATADVGLVTHWSAYRGTAPVAFGTLPNTTINNGDSFTINANTLQFNGSTT